jgi:magnesium-transporting ATPase (P-type)
VDDQVGGRRSNALLWIAAALAGAALLGALLVRRRRRERASRTLPKPQSPRPRAVLELEGLSEEEAADRLLEGQDNVILFKPPHSSRDILRTNTLTIFNLSLMGLATVQLLLGKPWDAVLTTAVLVFNIGLNVGQELWARGRLQEVERAARPQATVLRDGMARSIDPGEVVRGDVLVVGPGDQILADGQILGEGQLVVDESMLTGDPRQHVKQAGDLVYAGSFCISGHGAYEAQKVGNERMIAALTGEFQALEEELTPLERIVDRLLRVLLVVVAVLTLALLADYFDLCFPILHVDAFASAASVIFGLAPASLFLMILVNYAVGTADLARSGALVHRSRSVESLAQATLLCFSQAGILTGVGLQMEALGPSKGQPRLAESRIRQILGDYARSTSAQNPVVKAMLAAFPGGRRRVREEVPFLSAYGWSAVAFDDDDLRGTYLLGNPEVLETHLASDDEEPAEADEGKSELAPWRRQLAGLGIFWRSEDTLPGDQLASEPLEAQNSDPSMAPKEQSFGADLFRRFAKRAGSVLRRKESKPEEEEAGKQRELEADQQVDELVYLLAYHPEVVALHGADGVPRLPDGLIPLCRLCYTEQVRPEAVETVETFSRKGMSFKVFSPDAPEQTAKVLRRAGLGDDSNAALRAISGSKLATLDRRQLARAATEHNIFGHITPDLAEQVVKSLREQGEVVAVVGDGVNDLPPMQQAHLSITRQSSSPAALSVADIILLKDSPQVLPRVMENGQRIANGLFDVLKLYLTHLSYLGLLILVVWGTGTGFPYQSKQGSLIAIVTLVLPSLGLSLWATPGVLPRTNLGRLLARSVLPAAVAIGAAGVVVYWLFLQRTGEEAYAQLALTHMLVVSGLVLVILIRPPVRGLTDPRSVGVGGDRRSGDWRPAALALVLLVLVFVAAWIPLVEELFGLTHLRQPVDYLIVSLAVLAWASATGFIWRLMALSGPAQPSRA